MSFQRPPDGVKSTGLTMIFFGVLVVITPSVATLPKNGTSPETFTTVGLLLLLIGSLLAAAYYFAYRVHHGFVLVTREGRPIDEGWHFGLPPSSARLIHSARINLNIGNDENMIELETPDNGVIGATVNISYSPDFDNPHSLVNFDDSESVNKAIEGRVRGALNSWSMGKPVPGTLKRALAMQNEAEAFVREKLTGISTQPTIHSMTSLIIDNEFVKNDLGIRVHEVNITTWTPLEHGSGKPNWGDDAHIVFDAKSILKQFRSHANNLSELREVMAELKDKFPEDMHEDIEDMYFDVKTSMKETRDR